MHPILFQFGPITIFSYGILIACGFGSALWLAGKEGVRRGVDEKSIHDLGSLVLVAALVGSRALYVILEWSQFADEPLRAFAIWEGGLVFYGGLLLAVPSAIWFIRRSRLPVWITTDLAAPCVSLGQFFGRLGCFFAGCCYGAETSAPWAVTFSNPSGLAPLGVSLHPTQLYSAVGNLFLFLFLYYWARPRQRFDGQLFGLYLILYPTLRFAIEFFRADQRGSVGVLSTSQALGIPLVFLGVWILLHNRLKKCEGPSCA